MPTLANRGGPTWPRLRVLAGLSAIALAGVLFAAYKPGVARSRDSSYAKEMGHHYSFTWPYKRSSITLSSGQLQLRLDDPGSGADYIIGIKANADAQPWMTAGNAVYSQGVSTVFRPMSSIIDWPAGEMKLSPGEAEFWGLSGAKGSLMIYAEVPPGTYVSVAAPSGTIASERIQTSLLIYQGTIIPVAVAGMQTLAPVLMHPSPMTNSKELVALPSGAYVATPLGLGRHLVNLVRPAYPGGAPATEGLSAQLVLSIDEEGIVGGVTAMGGDPQAISASEVAVRQWRFRPFSVGGSVVAVRAPVLFVFSHSGAVWSPVFSELAK